jgi:hypothetical protein
MNFGLVGDFNVMPDLDDLAGDFTESIQELRQTAGLETRKRATRNGGPTRRPAPAPA